MATERTSQDHFQHDHIVKCCDKRITPTESLGLLSPELLAEARVLEPSVMRGMLRVTAWASGAERPAGDAVSMR